MTFIYDIYFSYFLAHKIDDLFKEAIIDNNLSQTEYLLESLRKTNKVKDFFNKNGEIFLSVCYRISRYSIAEQMIKKGAFFDVSYVALINGTLPITEIEQHLNNIRYFITDEEFISSSGIVKAHYSSSLLTHNLNSDFITDKVGKILNVTYTNDEFFYQNFTTVYSNFTSSYSKVIKDVISVVQYCSTYDVNVKIISPILKEGYKDAFCDYKSNLLLMPFFAFNSHEQSFFIHEAAHFVMYKIFNNYGTPFFKVVNDEEQTLDDYDNAVTETLCNIYSIFNESCKSTKKLGFSYYDVVKELKETGLFGFFNFRRNVLDDHLNISEENKKKMEEKFLELTVKFDINSDQVIILERIGEFLNRNSRELVFEFIVRLPELIIRVVNPDNLKYFKPIHDYWLRYASTAVDDFLKSHNCIDKENIEQCINVGPYGLDNFYVNEL